jgi:hypothetical protein
MNDRERTRLLHGPYRAAALHVGDRAFCLFRGAEVIITSWTDAPISWPRCRALHSKGGSGLLVDAELARAVRTESAVAIKRWWGVSSKAAWHWRRALSVGRTNNEGSLRLIQAASAAGVEVLKRDGLPDAVCDRMSERARRADQVRFLRGHPPIPPWTPTELRQLGVAPDDVVALRIGRSVGAVRSRRNLLGIPTARDRRRRAP